MTVIFGTGRFGKGIKQFRAVPDDSEMLLTTRRKKTRNVFKSNKRNIESNRKSGRILLLSPKRQYPERPPETPVDWRRRRPNTAESAKPMTIFGA
jgi:hypothetical protein